jgi:uncharacterized damage-inducible protein DinB
MMIDIEHLKYPIGKFQKPETISSSAIQSAIKEIESLPELLHHAVDLLSEAQLNTPYRPGGWTVAQLIHHLADSHMNAFIRFKLALTEHNPTIKPYLEAEWAKLPDCSLPVSTSLKLLEALHLKWSTLLQNMSETDFQRTYLHPEKGTNQPLSEITLLYKWHGTHHLAQIQNLRLRENW